MPDFVKIANQANATKLGLAVSTLLPTSCTHEGDNIVFSVSLASKLSATLRNSIFALFEGNMKGLYEASADGFHPPTKRNELFDSASRYVLLRTTRGKLVAFTMFRFDHEEDRESRQMSVLYCYELQIDPEAKRRGYGKILMAALEELARAFRMTKVMLTVFKANQSACDFYTAIGFGVDEISPKIELGDDEADYVIMSREVSS